MSNKEQYKTICTQHPEMLVFAQAWWLDVVCGEWDAAVAVKGEHVKGVWPYPVEKKMGISMIRTPTLTPYLSPQVFIPADVKDSNKDSYEQETIAELIKQLPAAQVWNLAMHPEMKQAGLLKNYGLDLQARQTFILDLTFDEATIFANFKDTTRRNIKQAEQGCVLVNDPSFINELFEFHKHTLGKKQKGIAHTAGDLQKLLNACIDNNSGTLWAVKTGYKIECIAWYVWDRQCCYFLMGAMNPESQNYKAMSLLHWHAIKEAKKLGCSLFDFEGSMDEGVERFFRSFGGKRELYLTAVKNNSLLWKTKQAILG